MPGHPMLRSPPGRGRDRRLALPPWLPSYRFRDRHGIRRVVDVLLKPLMVLVATGKDSHWWDWEDLALEAIDPDVPRVRVRTTHRQLRRYRRLPILGKYNLDGLRDLYLTLRVLPEVAVLEPVGHSGSWSLVIQGNYGAAQAALCQFLHRGRIKTLLDGDKAFVGLTADGRFVPLCLVERCHRSAHPEMLFV